MFIENLDKALNFNSSMETSISAVSVLMRYPASNMENLICLISTDVLKSNFL